MIWPYSAITLRSSTSTGTTGVDAANSGNITLTLGSAVVSTDIIIATVASDSGNNAQTTAPTWPSGWTVIGAYQKNQLGAAQAVGVSCAWAKGNVSNLTVTIANTHSDTAYETTAFIGVDNVTPIDVTGTGSSSTAAGSFSPGAATAVTTGALGIICVGDWLNGTYSGGSYNQLICSPNSNANVAILYANSTTNSGNNIFNGITITDSGTPTANQVLCWQQFGLRPAGGSFDPSTGFPWIQSFDPIPTRRAVVSY